MTAGRRYAVEITAGAEQDLDEIVGFVAAHDAPAKAGALLDRLLATAEALATAPQRGSVPRELQALGIRDYRQTLFKPYRVIYQVQDAPRPVVHIVIVADGRRDMATLLQRRLLSAPARPATPEWTTTRSSRSSGACATSCAMTASRTTSTSPS